MLEFAFSLELSERRDCLFNRDSLINTCRLEEVHFLLSAQGGIDRVDTTAQIRWTREESKIIGSQLAYT